MNRSSIKLFPVLFLFGIFQLSISSNVFAQSGGQNDFAISIQPAEVVLAPGESVNFTITVNGASANDVKLSLLELPPFDLVLGNKINGAKPLFFKVPLDSQTGTFDIAVAGISGGVTLTATAKITVVPGPARITALVLGVPFDGSIGILGTGFSPATRVFINGEDRTTQSTINSATSIVVEGSKKELGIVKGQNVLELKVDGITTSVLTFQFGLRK